MTHDRVSMGHLTLPKHETVDGSVDEDIFLHHKQAFAWGLSLQLQRGKSVVTVSQPLKR